MADALDEELAALQARAYGPGGGIADDPIALARLRELERRRAEAREPTDAPEPPDPLEALFAADEPAVAASTVPEREAELEPVAPPVEPPAEPPVVPVSLSVEPPVRRLDRRLRLAWIASLVVAVMLATGITAWTLPWGVRDEEHHDARLTEQAGVAPEDVRRQLGQWAGTVDASDDVRDFGEFAGMQIYAVGPCLIAMFSRDGEGRGASNGACGGGGLQPILDIYVPAQSRYASQGMSYPEELQRRFPDGAIVRFVLEGGTVTVNTSPLPSGVT